MKLYFSFLFFFLVFPNSYSLYSMYFEDSSISLYDALMDTYHRGVRPAEKHNKPLNVTFGFSLTQIIDVDEKNQILTTNAWLNQNWIDYKLNWSPKKYGNISKLHLPHDKVWLPDIVLYNNADSGYNSAIMSTDVFVHSDGNLTWLSAAIYKSSCQMNVRYYPFDVQNCTLKFASWAYDASLLELTLNSEEGDTSNYMPSTEWDLLFLGAARHTTKYSCCPEIYPDITITIIIQRRPMFYVFNLILPCVLITGIALLGFYMPSDSGEKVTLGITTLLSMTVFLMLVAESMPPTSDTLPLIGIYYGVTICLVTFATALTVFTLNIHHKGLRGSPVPKFIKLIAFKYLAKMLLIELDEPLKEELRTGHYKAHVIPSPVCESSMQSGSQNDTDHLLDNCRTPAASSFRTNISTIVAKSKPLQRFVGFSNRDSVGQRLLTPDNQGHMFETFEDQFMRVLNKVYITIERNEFRLAQEDRRDAIVIEWQMVALVVDRFLLVLFVIITTMASLLIIYQRELD